MLFRNTRERFGLTAKTFHWVMAVIILGLLTVGYGMGTMPASPAKIQLVYLHKSFGILILILAFGRLAWRFLSPRPDQVPTIKKWEHYLSEVIHFLIYVALFVMPLAGWIMTSASDYPANFFGLFNLPHIVPKNHDVAVYARWVHNTLAFIMMGIIALHFAGAAKHQVIDNDDTVRRMTWMGLSWRGGFALIALLGLLYLVPVAAMLKNFSMDDDKPAAKEAAVSAPVQGSGNWAVLPGSSIKFTVRQYGQTFDGEFKNFTANITFDPDNLPASHVEVTIPVSGISTGDDSRDTQARSADWFDESRFPQATFTSNAIVRTGDPNEYQATGRLKLRGVEKEIVMPFGLAITEENGHKVAGMSAELSLNRLDFGVGQGEWSKTDAIADRVDINIEIKATEQLPESPQ